MKNIKTNLGLLLQGVEFAQKTTVEKQVEIISDAEMENYKLVSETIEKARTKVFVFFKENREDFKKKANDIKELISDELEILEKNIDSEKITVVADGKYLRAYYGTVKIDGKRIKVCQMSTQNKKLLPNTTQGFLIWSVLGKITCNGKTKLCAKGCYNNCRQDCNNINFKIINLIFSFLNKKLFVETLQKIIAKTPHIQTYVRIHEDGDFYDREYFEKWVELSKKINVNFTAYTKEPSLMNQIKAINENFPNLYLRFSIMEDTNPKIIELVAEKNIPTFNCLGKSKNDKDIKDIKEFVDSLDDKHRCFGNCQYCKKCYTKGYNKIFVAMH